LCDGSYLDRMRVSPLNPIEARDLGVKIADALVHSHAAGVLHRDVKPANILYSHFNPAVLADFGLAVLGEMRDSSVTLEVLTPAYAPPEMFHHATPSPAVDIYALCASLYAVMRGRPPRWEHDRSPSIITLMNLFDAPIPDLPNVPHSLLEVLRYGMANEPRARPTAEQLRELLAGLHLAPPNGGKPYGPGTVPSSVYHSSGQHPGLHPSGGHQGGGHQGNRQSGGGLGTPRPVPPSSPTRDLPPGDDTPTVHTTEPRRSKRRWFWTGS
jgi:serine/threonine protein kinase